MGLGALVALQGCSGGCTNEVGAVLEAPQGDRIAVVFNRNCGATTGLNTQLSVLPRGAATPSQAGNALIADGTVPLKLRWKSDSELVVSGHQGATLFKQKHLANGVTISYE
jgi:hypothetical protein